MYAATTAGPGAFSGARWVATRACKAVRPPGATWFGDPARGSFLTTVWLLDGSQAGVGRVGRAARWRRCATQADRMFAGRDHLHTAVYRFAGEVAHRRRRRRRRPRSTIRSPVSIAIAVAAGGGPASACARSSGPELPVAAVFTPERVILAEVEPPPHDLVLGFTAGRSARRVARRGVEPALASLADASASRARSSVRSPAPTPTSTTCDGDA